LAYSLNDLITESPVFAVCPSYRDWAQDAHLLNTCIGRNRASGSGLRPIALIC
jgi:hypothetical protein